MRKIAHIDMDCFFAAVEMRDRPELRGLPVAVGGPPESRGVLSTCNYEARKYGLHSAMASAYALRLCPSLVLLPVDMAKYKAESIAISSILHRYTDLIEPLSLDEAYMDLSSCPNRGGSATLIAQEIREAIKIERCLTASAGIAPNKFLAKVASDWNKPDGQYTVTPEQAPSFAAALDLGKLPGVGKVSLSHFHAQGFYKCQDLLPLDQASLVKRFGRYGESLYFFARGIDERPVENSWERKSLSVEDTFAHDIAGLDSALKALEALYPEFLRRLSRLEESPLIPGGRNKLFVKIKYGDFRTTTIERGFADLSFSYFASLLQERYIDTSRPIRLLGLGLRFPDEESRLQTWLQFHS